MLAQAQTCFILSFGFWQPHDASKHRNNQDTTIFNAIMYIEDNSTIPFQIEEYAKTDNDEF